MTRLSRILVVSLGLVVSGGVVGGLVGVVVGFLLAVLVLRRSAVASDIGVVTPSGSTP